MGRSEVDLSILWPFTAEQIGNYVAFLRREGALGVAAAVEAAATAWLKPGERTTTHPTAG